MGIPNKDKMKDLITNLVKVSVDLALSSGEDPDDYLNDVRDLFKHWNPDSKDEAEGYVLEAIDDLDHYYSAASRKWVKKK